MSVWRGRKIRARHRVAIDKRREQERQRLSELRRQEEKEERLSATEETTREAARLEIRRLSAKAEPERFTAPKDHLSDIDAAFAIPELNALLEMIDGSMEPALQQSQSSALDDFDGLTEEERLRQQNLIDYLEKTDRDRQKKTEERMNSLSRDADAKRSSLSADFEEFTSSVRIVMTPLFEPKTDYLPLTEQMAIPTR